MPIKTQCLCPITGKKAFVTDDDLEEGVALVAVAEDEDDAPTLPPRWGGLRLDQVVANPDRERVKQERAKAVGEFERAVAAGQAAEDQRDLFMAGLDEQLPEAPEYVIERWAFPVLSDDVMAQVKAALAPIFRGVVPS